MSIIAKIDGGVLAIKVGERFDFASHKTFREASNQEVLGLNRIEVDLAATDYLDSSALGMLLILRDKMKGNKDKVVIKGARADVKKILLIANFDKLFTLT
jgi:anti-anti-sigma factor